MMVVEKSLRATQSFLEVESMLCMELVEMGRPVWSTRRRSYLIVNGQLLQRQGPVPSYSLPLS